MKKNLLTLCMAFICCIGLASSRPPGNVSFNASSTNGCAPFPVTFTNTSSIGNYYKWQYNDGTPMDTTVNTMHTFSISGNFNVMLSAFDTIGHSMTFLGSTMMNINVNGLGLNTSADTLCPGETLSASTWGGNGNNYSWSFGDGTTSTQSYNANHTYTTPGVDTLKLSVQNGCGGTQLIVRVVVVKINANPSAHFNTSLGGNNNMVCPNDMVQFYPRNSNASTYSWDFGDGNNSTQSQPSHTYSTTGKFAVTLTLTSTCGTSSMWTDTVRVNGGIHFSSGSNISSSANQLCPHDQISLNYYGNTPNSLTWKFGTTDSVTGTQSTSYSWTTAGTYTVTLHLHNGCNNDTTLSKVVMVKTNLPYSGNVQTQIYPNPACPNEFVSFRSNQASSYEWYFGDAAHDSSNMAMPNFAYTALGTYTVNLKLYNGCGRDTIVSNTLTIDNTSFPFLMAGNGNNNNWGSTTTATCPGDTALFYAAAQGTMNWNFGDGTTAIGGTPFNTGNGVAYLIKHAFTTLGTFWVKLKVTNTCGNSAVDSLQYTVGNSQPVVGSLNILGDNQNNNTNSANTCQKMLFIGGGGSTYKWFFGNGDSIITHSTSAPYGYPKAGNYTITLKVINGCGNTATYTKQIQIYGIMPSSVPTNLMCNMANNGMIVTNASGGYPSYNYSLDGGTYQLSNTFSNLAAGTYTVSIRDSLGCMVSTVSTISEPTALAITPGSVSSTCGNSDGTASVTVSGGTPAYTYSWTGGGTTSSIVGKPAGSYAVKVTDMNGCVDNTSVVINDVGGPVVTYPGTLPANCIGVSSYALSGGSPAGGTYSGLGVSGGAFFNPAAAGAGTHTIVYTYTSGGCTSSASNMITVNALPHVTAGSTPANGEVCTGGSVTLTGGGASTYSWSGGKTDGVAFVPGGSLTYTVTGTDANNCTATATVAIVVNPYPVVTLSFTGSDTIGDCASNFTLNQGTPAGGTYSGPGVVGNIFQPSSTGDGTFTITYSYTNGSGCMASNSAAIHVLPCPLVVTELSKVNIRIYPNPSNGLINVETADQNGTIQVYNAMGQIVYAEKITRTSTIINLQSQPAGMYLVKLEGSEGVAVQRILINK